MHRILLCVLLLCTLSACAPGAAAFNAASRFATSPDLWYRDGKQVDADAVEKAALKSKAGKKQHSTRAIVLVHSQTGEKVAVTYWKNGAYDPKAMASIDRLMRDRKSGEVYKIDPDLIDFISDLIYACGLPADTPVEVTSGYRSPQTNTQLAKANRNVARESFHMQGKAADLRIPGLSGKALTEIAKTMQRGGTAYYTSSGHVHVDVGEIRTWVPKR